MADDTKVISAIRALHERFVEEPTARKIRHIKTFISGSFRDVSPPVSDKICRYHNSIHDVWCDNFSPASLAHLNEVAKECLG